MSSSIAVAADSTQSEQHGERRRKTSSERKHKRRGPEPKKTKKGQRTQQKKALKRKQTDKESSGDDSDLDFSKELKPIVGYLDDRELMVDHMYRSISATKLRSMLPEIMKPLSSADLKQLCLEQLEVMSKKRIRRILEGANPDTISSSGTEDSGDEDKEIKEEAPLDEGTGRGPVADSTYQASWELRKWSDPGNESLGLTTGQHGGTHQSRETLDEGHLEDIESLRENIEEGGYEGQEVRQRRSSYSSSDRSPILTLEVQDRSLYEELEDGELPSEEQNRSTIHCHLVETPVQPMQENIPSSATETIAADSNTATSEGAEKRETLAASKGSGAPVGSSTTSPKLSKTQREILELEMRARAIKAMLKAHEERKRRLALESTLVQTKPK